MFHEFCYKKSSIHWSVEVRYLICCSSDSSYLSFKSLLIININTLYVPSFVR